MQMKCFMIGNYGVLQHIEYKSINDTSYLYIYITPEVTM